MSHLFYRDVHLLDGTQAPTHTCASSLNRSSSSAASCSCWFLAARGARTQPKPHHTPSQTCTYATLHMLTHGQTRTQSTNQHHTELLQAVMSQKYPTHAHTPVPAPSAARARQLPAAAAGSWQPGKRVPQPTPHCCCLPWRRVHAGGASGTRALRVKMQGEPNRGRSGGVFRWGRSQRGVQRRGR
jgi:hypothetical protein